MLPRSRDLLLFCLNGRLLDEGARGGMDPSTARLPLIRRTRGFPSSVSSPDASTLLNQLSDSAPLNCSCAAW